MSRPYGRVLKGASIPYGTLVGASQELRMAYYAYGYLKDTDLPLLPEVDTPWPHYDLRDVENRLDAQRLADLLRQAADSYVMSHRRFQVLYMREVLDMTLEEIGGSLGITHERVRQICERARHDCKRALKKYGVTSL